MSRVSHRFPMGYPGATGVPSTTRRTGGDLIVDSISTQTCISRDETTRLYIPDVVPVRLAGPGAPRAPQSAVHCFVNVSGHYVTYKLKMSW